jgi:Tfp pilus assembly protein FimT
VQHKENIMKTTVSKWAVKAAGAGAVALLLATPSFAQSRGDWSRNNSNRGGQTSVTRSRDNRSNTITQTRETQRAVAPGRINTFSREREVDRPRFENRDRDRDFRGRLSINVGGVFRGGGIAVGVGRVPYAYAPVAVYNNGFVRGVVERVDYRDGAIVVRDDASGRLITADVAGGGYGLGNLRSGDYVQLTGQWLGGGVFNVTSINRG